MFEFDEEDRGFIGLVDELVQRVFCSMTSARYGPYTMAASGTQILRDTLYQYRIFNRDGSYLLQLYTGLKHMGGKFWEQEVRTLMRLGRIGHPALPVIRRGAFDEAEGEDFAFVISDSSEATLNDRNEMDFFRNNKGEALRQLGILADALTILHLNGIQHRNLWPGTIERYSAEGRPHALRLVRFEMSTLFVSLFRSLSLNEAGAEQNERRNQIRTLSIEQGPRALACFAPERLETLLTPSPSQPIFADVVHSSRADVFSLGVIASQWFATGPPNADAMARLCEGGVINLEASEDFRRTLRQSLRPAELPKGLRSLLEKMTETRPQDRPDAKDVCSEIFKNYQSWTEAWRPTDKRKRLVVFFPSEEIKKVICDDFQLVVHDPTTPAGKEETQALIADDVSGRALVYSPEGFKPFAGNNIKPPMSEAKYVLLGQRAAWFCQLYRPEGRNEAPWNDVLLVKYVAQADRLNRGRIGELYKAPFPQAIGDVEVEPAALTNRDYLNHVRKGRPEWKPLLDATEFDLSRPPDHVMLERALTFLITFFNIELQARFYPFTCESTGTVGDTVDLVYDGPRWDARVMNADTALFSFYINHLDEPRPYFGHFFTSPYTFEEGSFQVDYLSDRNGLPNKKIGKAIIDSSKGIYDLRLTITDGKPIPAVGWLVPSGDHARAVELKRQALAVSDLVTMGALIGQLHTPWTTRLLRHNWEGAGADLQDEILPKEKWGQHFVQEMLACQPFYALHGPPGTGKTNVVAHAIVEQLERDPTARILVSAQSNFALDNLGERITRLLRERGKENGELEKTGRILRISSEAGVDKISPPIRKHRLQALTEETVQTIKSSCETALEELKTTGSGKVVEIVKEWTQRVAANNADLKERVRKSTNIVLTTCSQATTAVRRAKESDGEVGLAAADEFDWVIIEEAAKAWPTELAIPLVRGFRWALVGDHKQLPAHRLKDIDKFLRKCEDNRDSEIRRHGEDRLKYNEWFETFRTLFEGHKSDESTDQKRPINPPARQPVKANKPPVGRMSVQYRMRSPIAEVIGSAFYKSPRLESHPSVDQRHHGLVSPRFLADGCSLVWLDTHQLPGYEETTNWENKGEAVLVRDFLYKLDPFPEKNVPPFTRDPLAIVTPYRAQNNRIRKLLRSDGEVPTTFPVSSARRSEVASLTDPDIVHSVHSIQGREADVVVASLVRTGQGGNTVFSAMGHVAEETLVNVLFSRARLLLVLIGDFDFFQRAARLYSPAAFWGDVCEAIVQNGQRITAEELYASR